MLKVKATALQFVYNFQINMHNGRTFSERKNFHLAINTLYILKLP